MTTVYFQILKDKLPKNYAATIADNLGLTSSYVRKVLNETRGNPNILDAGIKPAKKTSLINLQ